MKEDLLALTKAIDSGDTDLGALLQINQNNESLTTARSLP